MSKKDKETYTLEDFMQQFSAEERAEIESGAAADINEQRLYSALREAYAKAQHDVANELALSPDQIDRVAHQSFLFIKKLQSAFAQKGGILTMTAELPDVAKAEIKDIEDIL